MAEEVAVLAEDLWVELGGREVLKGVNLLVGRGELWAILGPNGAGKTTFLKALVGLIRPSRGKVSVMGLEPSRAQRLGLLGYVPQVAGFDLDFPMNLFEFVSTGLFGSTRPFGPLGRRERTRVLEAIERVGLLGMEGRPIGSLSGGELQRATVARALVLDPPLLLLDEPTSGVDVGGVGSIYELLSSLNVQGKTVLMATHDVATVMERASGVACMEGGRLVAHGRPPEVAVPVMGCLLGGEGSLLFAHGEIPHMVVRRHRGDGP